MNKELIKDLTLDLQKISINSLYTQVILNINNELNEFKKDDYDTKRLRTLTILLRTLKTVKQQNKKTK